MTTTSTIPKVGSTQGMNPLKALLAYGQSPWMDYIRRDLLTSGGLKKMIDEEDTAHPLTDDLIAKKLDDAGIHVTRRTVAKYREDLRIPSTHQRRVKV